MDFALDDDQQLIVETVRRFADRDLRAWAADADRAGAPPERLRTRRRRARLLARRGAGRRRRPARGPVLARDPRAARVRARPRLRGARGAARVQRRAGPRGRDAGAAPPRKRTLFASLAAGGLATFVHDSRGTLAITEGAAGGSDVRLTGKLGPAPALATAAYVLIADRETCSRSSRPTAMRREPITPSGWRAARWATAQLEAHRVPAELVLSRDPARDRRGPGVGAYLARGPRRRRLGRRDGPRRELRQGARPVRPADRPLRVADPAARRRADHRRRGAPARAVRRRGSSTTSSAGRPRHARAAPACSPATASTRATIDAVQIFGGYGFVNDYPGREAHARCARVRGAPRRRAARPRPRAEGGLSHGPVPRQPAVRRRPPDAGRVREAADPADRDQARSGRVDAVGADEVRAVPRPDPDRGGRRPQEADRRRRGSDPKKPKSQARLAVAGSEELAWGCAGICLALGGSGLAASPVARMGTEEQKQEFRKLLTGEDEQGPHPGRGDGAVGARRPARTSRGSRPPRAPTATTT